MFEDLQDDAIAWVNYAPTAHPAEIARLSELISDPTSATAMLAFGFRPLGPMDLDPYNQPFDYFAPWAPGPKDISPEPIVVDTATGWRFRVDPASQRLVFDVQGSDNYLEAQVLLSRAQARKSEFKFETHYIPAFQQGADIPSTFPVIQPINLVAHSTVELRQHIDALRELFCGQLPVKRLWFRGQRQEYLLSRHSALSNQLYGAPLPSLTPSLERFAKTNPDRMNYGFAWSGPNHSWKKPFLIWLMRQNAHWFASDERFLPLLADILADDNNLRFAQLLMKIQMSPQEIGDEPHLAWPDEADDLRQWFFAHMKRREFSVTLQQYGYYTSLLDLTDDLDVALYFSQASMVDRMLRCAPPKAGRVIYVFAQGRGDFYHHGAELFWGSTGWMAEQPPRLARQKAGFIKGATNRTQNLYGLMIVARIWLGADGPVTSLSDTDLFPIEADDQLLRTLRASRPELEGLY